MTQLWFRHLVLDFAASFKRNCLFLLGGSHHAIFHQSSFESTMHAFNTVGISQSFDIGFWLEDEATRVLNSLQDGMPPTGNGFPYPICCCHLVHESSVIDQLGVSFFRNKVGMSPIAFVSNGINSSRRSWRKR